MKQNTEDRIIQAALEALAMNPRGSLDEIAEAAGVGRATLYRYFESRETLMKKLFHDVSIKLDAATIPIFEDNRLTAENKLSKLINVLVPFGARIHFAALISSTENNPELQQGYKMYLARLNNLCQQLKDQHFITPEISTTWLVASLDALIFTAWKNIYSGDIAPNDAPELVLRTFLNGVGMNETNNLKRLETGLAGV